MASWHRRSKPYQAPKSISQHPGVQECDDGYADSDYKHDVLLREGWAFSRGRMAGCRSGFFHTIQDFLHAEPTLCFTDGSPHPAGGEGEL